MSDQITAISIIHISGHNSGKVQSFPLGMNEIQFARGGDPTHSVLVDMKDVAISRDGHGSIDMRKHGKSQAYWFIPRAEHRADINGLPIAESTALRNGDTIKLGGTDGISFKIEIHEISIRDANDNSKTTEQEKTLTIRDQLRRNARLVAVAFTVLALGLIGYSYFSKVSLESRLQAVAEEIRREAATNSERLFVPAVLGKLEAATYLIAVEGSNGTKGIATAWAYGEDTLVTNAHVAKEFLDTSMGEKLVAIQSASGKIWDIATAPKFHPGYGGFKQFLDANPRGLRTSSGEFQSVSIIEGYDLAFLKVSGQVPLPVTLELADENTLTNINIGTKLAYAGYPLDTTVFAKQLQVSPKPNIQFGYITAISNFFGLPSDNRKNDFLIHHNLPAEGGTSGSPIIDSDGKVIAILSAGNILKVQDGQGKQKRVANPVQINFGQRADLVLSIFETETYVQNQMSSWKRAIGRFKKREIILTQYLGVKGRALFKKEMSNPQDLAKRINTDKKDFGAVSIFEFEMRPNDFDGSAILIRSKDRSGISVVFEQSGKRKKPFKMESQNDYVMAWFSNMSDENLKILVHTQNKSLENIELQTGFF